MRTPKESEDIYRTLFREMELGRYRIGDRIPTERVLAARFGVSRPTVSRAIRRLVGQSLIRRNGRAGSRVISMPPRRSLTFGAVLWGLAGQHHDESPFGAAGREMLYRAELEGRSILLHDPTWSDDPIESGLPDRYHVIARELIDRRVSGVFLMPRDILPDQYISPTAAIADDFKAAGIAVVLIDRDIIRYPARSHLDMVGIDNFGAGFTLTEHFIKLGCRKIDFFAYVSRVPTQESRIAGYLKALAFHGIHPDPAGIYYGDLFDRDSTVERLKHRRPEAVLVVSDSRAARVMRFALDADIKIPQKLRIGSFDDLPSAARLPVPLTTVRQPGAALGYFAYRTMMQRIEEPTLPPVHLELSGELVVRASSGIAPRPHRSRN